MNVHDGASNIILFERKRLIIHYPSKLNYMKVMLPTKSRRDSSLTTPSVLIKSPFLELIEQEIGKWEPKECIRHIVNLQCELLAQSVLHMNCITLA